MVSRTEEHLELAIGDDGCGFDPADVGRRGEEEHGMGLLTMSERAHLLRGEFHVSSSEGHGTRIEVQVPLGRYHAREADAPAGNRA